MTALKEILQNNIAGVVTLVFVAGGLYHKIDNMDTNQTTIEQRVEKQNKRHKEEIEELKKDIHELRMEVFNMQKCNH